jgi:hypothetical protein
MPFSLAQAETPVLVVDIECDSHRGHEEAKDGVGQ